MNETVATFSVNNERALATHPAVLEKLRKINTGAWSSYDERDELSRNTLGSFGAGSHLLELITFTNGANIFVGKEAFINSNVIFIDAAPITIGDHSMIAPGCVLTTVDHPISAKERRGMKGSYVHRRCQVLFLTKFDPALG